MIEPVQLIDSKPNESGVTGNVQAEPPRLLVIDDDKLHRMIICRAGAKSGYAPAGAASYEEASKLMQETAFDCITLDLSLGPHAGIEILHLLWKIGCKASILVISGCDSYTCADTVRLAKSLNLNVVETITKPVDLAVVQYWLEKLRAGRLAAAVAA